MDLPIGADPRQSTRGGMGTPGLGRPALALVGAGALAVGIARRSVGGALVAAIGAALAWRGLTGSSFRDRLVDPDLAARPRFRLSVAAHPRASTTVAASITVNREREPVYLFWRNAANVALLREWVVGVDEAVDGQPRWRIQPPFGAPIEIEGRVVEDVELERVAWASVDDEAFRVVVELGDPPDRRGTEVTLSAHLPAPAGRSPAFRMLTAPLVEAELEEMLRRARSLIETGEIATTEGQPSGREEANRQGEPLGAPPPGEPVPVSP